MKDFSKEIRAYALRNAIEFGKAEAGKILPKLFQHGLDKKDIKKVMPEIHKIVAEINSLSAESREKEYAKLEKVVKTHEEREGLPELEGAEEGKVITRLAPEPSKYIHIGHALIFIIQYLYAKKYSGKCYLRFDDTNPEKSEKEYYDSIKEDLAWLGIKCDKEIIASNELPTLYKYAEKLIDEKKAYACTCTQEQMKELREKMKECKHRKNGVKENKEIWKNMLAEKYEEEKAVLRLKGDMKSNNGVMRDPVIFRISYAPHFLTGKKYCIWPMYDFESAIEDSINGITNIIRSNEFEMRAELHDYIISSLGLRKPNFKEIGRYQITGAETQGRVIREMIEKKEIKGWDDPRLVTIKALRRRGFSPKMFHELAQVVGLSKNSGHIDMSVLAAINRKIIDSETGRYSFVEDPVELKISGAPKIKEVEIPVHPDKEEKRKIKIGKIFIAEKDFSALQGKEIRLLHLFNINLEKKIVFTSSDNKDIPKINWVSDGKKIKVLMPDGKWVKGLAEEGIDKIEEGEVVQFERFGFCKLDKKGKEPEFWFTHK